MRIYLAGTPGVIEREKAWQKLLKRRLHSFWDISQNAFAVYEAFKLSKK